MAGGRAGRVARLFVLALLNLTIPRVAGGPGAIWVYNSNSSKNGGEAFVGNAPSSDKANAAALGAQQLASTAYCISQ